MEKSIFQNNKYQHKIEREVLINVEMGVMSKHQHIKIK